LKSESLIATLIWELGRSRSTIYREIKRNTGQRGYRVQQAAKFASQNGIALHQKWQRLPLLILIIWLAYAKASSNAF